MEQRTTPQLGRALYATKAYSAGELIHSEAPFLIVSHELRDVVAASPKMPKEVLTRLASLFAPEPPYSPDVVAALKARGLPISGPGARVALTFDCNSFSWGTEKSALLERGSLFAHSCLPNVSFEANLESGVEEFRATVDIAAGDLLAISYLGDIVFRGTDERRSMLRATKFFTCACPRCTTGYDGVSGVPCPKCKSGTAMRNQSLGEDTDMWECGSCAASLSRSDWPDGFWAKAKLLVEKAEKIDNAASCLGQAPEIEELEALHSELVGVVGQYHWSSMAMLLMLFDICSTTVRYGLSFGILPPKGISVARMLEIEKKFTEWLSFDRRLCFPEYLSPLSRERKQVLLEMVAMTNTPKQPVNEEKKSTCAQCGSEEHLMACSRCHETLYCSKECQRKHWKNHKAVCKTL